MRSLRHKGRSLHVEGLETRRMMIATVIEPMELCCAEPNPAAAEQMIVSAPDPQEPGHGGELAVHLEAPHVMDAVFRAIDQVAADNLFHPHPLDPRPDGPSPDPRAQDGLVVEPTICDDSVTVKMDRTANIDNDKDDQEEIVQDPNLPSGSSYGADQDNDGDHDVITIGTKDGAQVNGTSNVDNDKNDQEVIVEDPNLPAGSAYGVDLDGDKDHDVITIGTKGGAKINGTSNVDNDKNDQEVIVEDPNLPAGNSYGVDLDGDGDHDVIIIGTKNGAKVNGTGNVDNDKDDQEVIVEDPSLPAGNSYGVDLDGDGDHDVIVIGTKDGAKVTGTGNVDNDKHDQEVIVQDPNLPAGNSYGVDLDGDGDHDVTVTGAKERARRADRGRLRLFMWRDAGRGPWR